jgi:hypothetical protein
VSTKVGAVAGMIVFDEDEPIAVIEALLLLSHEPGGAVEVCPRKLSPP